MDIKLPGIPCQFGLSHHHFIARPHAGWNRCRDCGAHRRGPERLQHRGETVFRAGRSSLWFRKLSMN